MNPWYLSSQCQTVSPTKYIPDSIKEVVNVFFVLQIKYSINVPCNRENWPNEHDESLCDNSDTVESWCTDLLINEVIQMCCLSGPHSVIS